MFFKHTLILSLFPTPVGQGYALLPDLVFFLISPGEISVLLRYEHREFFLFFNSSFFSLLRDCSVELAYPGCQLLVFLD